MARFSIVSSIYNEYELLRQYVESILHNVDEDSYDRVIIIDDHSRPDKKLREYEDYVNKTYKKFNIIRFDEYRCSKFYQQQRVKNKEISDTFDYRDFDTEEPNLGVCSGYQFALEKVNTEFVLIADIDCVFLSKFKYTFNDLANLYDENLEVMAASQLMGFSSDEVFVSKFLGSRNVPQLSNIAGCISPMCSSFRIEAWTKHNLVPIASTPNLRRGHGFSDFFYSVIGSNLAVLNFPFFSGQYIYHMGGGVARRNTNNVIGAPKIHYGRVKDSDRLYGGRSDVEKTYDYYAGSHYIDMLSDEYTKVIVDKYNIPCEQLAEPFDETLLKKLELVQTDDLIHKTSQTVLDRILFLISEHTADIKKELWNRYTYGKPSEINWPEQHKEKIGSTLNKELEMIEIRKQQEKERMKAGTNELVEVPDKF